MSSSCDGPSPDLKAQQPSKMADYKIELGVNDKIRRSVCTPGTRANLLQDIIRWAENDSSEGAAIYWLFGPAGSGKTTIAYTIARHFERAAGVRSVILGANFFCSRQFEDAKQSKLIIPTIVYHLARVCNPLAEALDRFGKFDAVDHSVESQIHDLFIEMWEASADAREGDPSVPPYYLVVIDALDEIDGTGGSAFLHELFDTLNKAELRGIKFFATSRSDPALVSGVTAFKQRKHLYRLQDVDKAEASQDIETYINAALPHLKGHDEIGQLVGLSDGLFIYAATIVRYLADHQPSTQKALLKRSFAITDSGLPSRADEVSPGLDELYRQILLEVFPKLSEEVRTHELVILHTFLCTVERTSEETVAQLLNPGHDGNLEVKTAIRIVQKLHAVLYIEHGRVLAYHKSFSDFIFDRDRSHEFWCNQEAQHRQLAESCFRVMKVGLKFNIANIPSSFILDLDNVTLRAEVDRNITAVLRYACQHWSYHLCSSGPISDEPFSHVLTDFLDIRALFWMEAMNLLGLAALCDSRLRDASRWIREVGCLLSGHMRNIDIVRRLTQESPAIWPRPRALRYRLVAARHHPQHHTCTSPP